MTLFLRPTSLFAGEGACLRQIRVEEWPLIEERETRVTLVERQLESLIGHSRLGLAAPASAGPSVPAHDSRSHPPAGFQRALVTAGG